MSKTDMIEDLIRSRPRDLMLDALWEDWDIVEHIRQKLMGVSRENLGYYVDHFQATPSKHVHKTIGTHGNIITQGYVDTLHNGE